MRRCLRRQRGVTLIEVMTASMLGVMLTASLAVVYVQGSRGSRQDINIATMLDELSFATAFLVQDLEMAGYWAQVHDPAAVDTDASLVVDEDCGPAGAIDWAYGERGALAVLDNPTGADVEAAYSCIPASDVQEGADVIAIKRVLGRVASTEANVADLVDGTVYLRTHDRAGRLYLHGAGTPGAISAPFENREYRPSIYYVQRYATRPTESPAIPTLCRRTLEYAEGRPPTFVRECLAQGIENFQVEVGVDSDEDGSPNYFSSAPDAAELSRASMVRLYLLGRTLRPDVDYRNEKTYQLGNAAPFTPSGASVQYYRKTLSTEVILRNPRSLQGIAVQ